MTKEFGKAMIYPVIALRKLEKPVVRRAPEGAFRYLWKYKGGGEMKKKRFLTYEEQIVFLRDKKKLEIQDVEYAKSILFKTGYFPLINGYKESFKDTETNQFQKGVSFEDIYELYRFDNDLRSIFIKYILMVERNVKSSLAYQFCLAYGDMQEDYLNPKHYDYAGKKKAVINTMLKIMSGQVRSDSDYAYVRHYIEKYKYVPLWVLLNVLTIGQLSKIYSCQKGRVKIRICQDFGPIKVNEMGKMLAVMTKFRNVCAHNDRLFDFRTKDAVLDMNIHERLLLSKVNGRYEYGKNDLFAQLIILKLLLPEDEFKAFYHDLKLCFQKHPVHKEILDKMGFPENWERIGRIKKYTKKEL